MTVRKDNLYSTIVFSVTVAVCAAYSGAYGSTALAVLVLTLSAFSLLIARSVSSILMISVPVGISLLYGGDFAFAALICSVVVTVGLGSYLFATVKSPFIPAVIPAAYLVAFLFGRDPIVAFLSLIAFPAAFVLSRTFNGKSGRLSVICYTSATLIGSGLITLVIWIAAENGGLAGNVFVGAADKFFDRLVVYYTEQYAELAARYETMGISAVAYGLSAEDAKEYAVAVYGIIPALAVVAVNVVSFIGFQINTSILSPFEKKRMFLKNKLDFSMSWVSATVFIIAGIVMLYNSYAGNETVALIAQNIYLILLPGLVLTAILLLLGKGENGRSHVFLLIGLALIALNSPSAALTIAGIIGSGAIIISAVKKFLYDKFED
ncbi:MAG: hypothetical protein J5894_01015 [Clostridia bacterium]|nr:hypothetical protein [Clostridia bacterium]